MDHESADGVNSDVGHRVDMGEPHFVVVVVAVVESDLLRRDDPAGDADVGRDDGAHSAVAPVPGDAGAGRSAVARGDGALRVLVAVQLGAAHLLCTVYQG